MTLNIKGHEVVLNPSEKAGRIVFSVKPFKQPKVSYPHKLSQKAVISWLQDNSEQIVNAISKIKSYEIKKEKISAGKEYKTAFKKLIFNSDSEKTYIKSDSDSNSFRKSGIINIYIDEKDNSREFQEKAEKIYLEILRIEAKNYLPQRVEALREKYKFPERKVIINKAVTRWGSCSRLRINLTLHLMRLPLEIIDYVIMHELCHTKIQNHSEKYYKLLESICPDRKVFERAIKNYNPSIFP